MSTKIIDYSSLQDFEDLAFTVAIAESADKKDVSIQNLVKKAQIPANIATQILQYPEKQIIRDRDIREKLIKAAGYKSYVEAIKHKIKDPAVQWLGDMQITFSELSSILIDGKKNELAGLRYLWGNKLFGQRKILHERYNYNSKILAKVFEGTTVMRPQTMERFANLFGFSYLGLCILGKTIREEKDLKPVFKKYWDDSDTKIILHPVSEFTTYQIVNAVIDNVIQRKMYKSYRELCRKSGISTMMLTNILNERSITYKGCHILAEGLGFPSIHHMFVLGDVLLSSDELDTSFRTLMSYTERKKVWTVLKYVINYYGPGTMTRLHEISGIDLGHLSKSVNQTIIIGSRKTLSVLECFGLTYEKAMSFYKEVKTKGESLALVKVLNETEHPFAQHQKIRSGAKKLRSNVGVYLLTHYFTKKTLEEVAKESNLSENTIKLLLKGNPGSWTTLKKLSKTANVDLEKIIKDVSKKGIDYLEESQKVSIDLKNKKVRAKVGALLVELAFQKASCESVAEDSGVSSMCLYFIKKKTSVPTERTLKKIINYLDIDEAQLERLVV